MAPVAFCGLDELERELCSSRTRALVTSMRVSGDSESPPRPTATGGSHFLAAQSTRRPRGGSKSSALSRYDVAAKPVWLVLGLGAL